MRSPGKTNMEKQHGACGQTEAFIYDNKILRESKRTKKAGNSIKIGKKKIVSSKEHVIQ